MTEGNYYKVCVSNSSPVYKHETADFYLFHDEKSDKKWIISKGNIDFTPIDFSRFFDLGNYFNVAIILFQQFAFHLFPFFLEAFLLLNFFSIDIYFIELQGGFIKSNKCLAEWKGQRSKYRKPCKLKRFKFSRGFFSGLFQISITIICISDHDLLHSIWNLNEIILFWHKVNICVFQRLFGEAVLEGIISAKHNTCPNAESTWRVQSGINMIQDQDFKITIE